MEGGMNNYVNMLQKSIHSIELTGLGHAVIITTFLEMNQDVPQPKSVDGTQWTKFSTGR